MNAGAAQVGHERAAPARDTRDRLDRALIAAHEARDGARLVALYTTAADRAEVAGNVDAACFYLTHAYVFALETDHPDAATLHHRLKAEGREE